MKKVLILYTGGTFGMTEQLSTPNLKPAQLERSLKQRVPELAGIAKCDVEIVLNCDSAHIGAAEWRLLAGRIQARWRRYDGVVVLHGTDTMAYTAAALSLLLRPCLRPVILTGAQRPLSALRTDARRNLISAVEIAAHGPREQTTQVCVFFDNQLLRGNRVRKRSATEFGAFESPQWPALASVGTEIRYDRAACEFKRPASPPRLLPDFSAAVALLHVTPGFPARAVREQLLPRLQGLVLVIFGSGTAPTQDPEFLALLQDARARGVPVVVTVESAGGGRTESRGDSGTSRAASVSGPGRYAAGRKLLDAGVTWAGAMTPECAYVKTSWLLAQPGGARRFAALWKKSYAGEA